MSAQRDPSANIESVYPLSPMQEGMLFHTLLRPSSGVYLMQNRYRLLGELRVPEAVRAWSHVTARHPVMRTSFAWKTQKRPLQVVHRTVELPFEVLDWRDLAPDAQEARLQAILADERAAGFDFARAPLQCFRVIRLGEHRHELVHSFHHILFDEWCTSLLMMDFLACYEALVRGEQPELLPARPYRDYIDWIARQDRAAAEQFWRAELDGFTTPTPLGLEMRSASEQDVHDLASRLDAAATARLVALAQRHRLTLNTIVQGAWALLLSRYSGERDVAFGVTVAGRPPELPGVESIVGLFINTLPLRVQVAPDERVVPWLTRLLAQNLAVRDHEHTPLADVQRWSAIDRGQTLFHSLFVFENAPIDPALLAGRSFRVEHVQDRVHTNYPVTVMAWPDRELGLKVSYDRAQISTAAAERMLGGLRTLLEGIAANPDARLAELTLGEAIEAPPATAPDDLSSYAARFRAQVERTPDAVAVACGDCTKTYAELDRDANRVAHALRARGVGPEVCVALLDDRGIGLLTMILGVFKAGGAYVPLDTAYPDDRLAQIVASSRPRLVLTREQHRARAASTGAAVVTLEDLADERDDALVEDGGPGNLAYVIYTSGSTGVPKGAMVERRGMLNNMLSKVPRLGLAPGVRIAQTASPCFDISVWQFLTALLVGGAVEIIPDDVVRDPARLLDHVERREVTILEVVPAVLQGMFDSADARELPALRWILPTGEALPVALARAWLARFPAVPLMNAYGPAECSDDVALHPITVAPGPDETQVAIGRAVDHLRLYVLDHLLAPMPVGVAGELYVGGLGVGRGYLGDPARTAAAFVPDPFGGPGERLYRTGDLGRYRADGTIEFAGRRDHQVKLRGFRIELGEIEARLAEHPAVGDAAVIVREDRPGQKRLVGYVSGAVDADALRAWLAARLPEYMVPGAFLVMSALPRTRNGKIDRAALPAPDGDAGDPVAPRTPTETRLAAIWAEVLGVDDISVDASFFELGGHSLLLTQIFARVRRVFDVEVPLRALFEAPTVAGQARAIDRTRAGATTRAISRRSGDAPLSFAQERLWFLAQLDPAAAAYNVPAAVRIAGELDVARLRAGLASIVARHEALRTCFEDVAGKPRAVIAATQPVPLDVVDVAEGELRARLDAESARPFDVAAGPLLRATLFRLGKRDHVLLVVVHHIVSDGWSLAVLVDELTTHYTGGSLAPLPIQYGDYAAWQRDWLQGAALEPQLAYWRQRLGTELPVLRLPVDRPHPPVRSYRGARHGLALSRELTAGLQQLARAQGVTTYMLLLAGFEALLAGASGQTSFTVGTPVANRTREEVEGVIGLFVNTLVLRAELAGDPRFTDLLARTRDEVVGAQSHQDLPFDRLVQALRPARDLRHTPLFQVMFSLQDAAPRARRLADLELSPVDLDPGSAQFDLSLHLVVEGDQLAGAFEYSTDVFDDATIHQLAVDLERLLEAVVAQPTARLGELPLPLPQGRSGAAPEIAPTPPTPRARDAVAESVLAAIWAELLGRDHVPADENFFELGGDSILSLQVVAKARQAGLRLSARDLFQHPTVAGLAAIATAAVAPEGQGPVTGDVPMTPIQRRFFDRALPNPHHWNQALLLELPEPFDPRALEISMRALVAHHDALRLRFAPTPDGWHQSHADEETSTVLAEDPGAVERHAARWQASLDLTAGPVFRAVAFTHARRLLLVAHHLVVDAVSWRILLDDLQTAYEQARGGDPVALPAKTTSFQRWAQRLQAAADEPGLQAEAATWLDLPWSRVAAIPVDDPAADGTVAAQATYSIDLDEDATRALLEVVPAAYQTRIDEVLLTALARAIARWTGGGVAAIDVEGHGREDVGDDLDVSRTVGWFTSVYPVVLEVAADAPPGEALVAVKEQLRRIPRRGVPFGVVRELGGGDLATQLRALPTPRIAFDYLGQWDGARLAFAEESPGPEHDPRSPLPYELEIDAAIHGGRLDATWRYSGRRYRRDTVATIAAHWRDALVELIAHCSSPDAGGYSPSDFPDVALAPDELDALLGRMD